MSCGVKVWLTACTLLLAAVTPHAVTVRSQDMNPAEDLHLVGNFRLRTHVDETAAASTHKRFRDGSGHKRSPTPIDPTAPYGNAVSVQLEAFGVQFDWQLQLNRHVFAEGATVHAVLPNGTVYERPARSVTYMGWNGEDGGWVRLAVTKSGSIRAFFLYQQQLRVVQPTGMLQQSRDWQDHMGERLRGFSQDDLVVYTYMSGQSNSAAFHYVNDIVNRLAPRKSEPTTSELDTPTASLRAMSDVSPLHRARRLAIEPEVINACIPWTNTPYGKMANCPSTTKEIRMGVASDTGYTKAVTGYGTTGISAVDAVDLVEEDTQMNNNILNVLTVDMANVYVRLQQVIVKLVVDSDAWNQEPLNPSTNEGETRGTTGCYTSRTVGTTGNADTDATLELFRTWYAALPAGNKHGLWHLMTNCYPPNGVVGKAYIGETCDSNYGVGWSNFDSRGSWETFSHEVGHNFGAFHTMDTGGIMSYDIDKEFTFTGSNPTEICNHINSVIASSSNCYTNFLATCGNNILEPGEQCDDSSACCHPTTCQLTSGAQCSPGSSSECCTSSCQYESVQKDCQVCGGTREGYCYLGMCRGNSAADKYSNTAHCTSPAGAECVEYRSIDGVGCYSGSSYKTDGGVCGTNKICSAGTCVTGQAPTPAPAPGPSPTPAPGPSPTPAPGPSPTPAPGPSPTPAPGPSPTPAPGPTPSPTPSPTDSPSSSSSTDQTWVSGASNQTVIGAAIVIVIVGVAIAAVAKWRGRRSRASAPSVTPAALPLPATHFGAGSSGSRNRDPKSWIRGDDVL